MKVLSAAALSLASLPISGALARLNEKVGFPFHPDHRGLFGAEFSMLEQSGQPAVDGELTIGQSVNIGDLPREADANSDGQIDDETLLFYKITNARIAAGRTISCYIDGCQQSSDAETFVNLFMYELNLGSNFEIGTFSAAVTHVCPAGVSLTFSGNYDGYVFMTSDGSSLNGGTLTCYDVENGSIVEPWNWCFSEASTVEVQGKGSIEMKDLQVNDKVFVGADSNGTPTYESVYAFGHLDKETPIEYLQVYTGSAKPLEISAAHLLYVEGKAHPVRADSIQKGDTLIESQVDGLKKPVKVTKIDKVIRSGAYMPLTKSGSIVVNQVLASSYVSIMDTAPEIVSQYLKVASEDQLLHWWLAPYRLVCETAPSLCENDYNGEGIAYWLVVGRFVAKVGNSMGTFGQTIGLVAFGLFMAVAMAAEALVFFLGTPLGFAAGATLVGWSKGAFGRNGVAATKKVD